MDTRYLKAISEQIDLLQYYSSDLAKTILGLGDKAGVASPYGTATGLGGMNKAARRAISLGDSTTPTYRVDNQSGLDFLVINLKAANPVYVSSELADMLQDSLAEFPDGVKLYEDSIPIEVGYASLEGDGWVINGLTPAGFQHDVRALLWARSTTGQGAYLAAFGTSRHPDGEPTPLQVLYTDFWTFGSSADDDGEYRDRLAEPDAQTQYNYWDVDENDNGVLRKMTVSEHEALTKQYLRDIQFRRYAMMLWTFMSQKLVTLREGGQDRPTRRRVERERPDMVGRIVQVVELRAKEHNRSMPKNTGEGSERTPISVRYIRRGHWHKYWCQGKGKGCLHRGHTEPRLEPRWIDSTVCGPDDAPLKEGSKLYAVVR